MDFVFSTQVNKPVDEAIEMLKAALVHHQLGIVSEVNVSDIVQNKLGREMPAYRILGACNPKMAKTMIDDLPQAGVLLPCTIVAREAEGATIFDFMDPVSVFSISDNKTMQKTAEEARVLLESVVNELEQE